GRWLWGCCGGIYDYCSRGDGGDKMGAMRVVTRWCMSSAGGRNLAGKIRGAGK
nr:hypothetical protein [Tanacetum cinerariifolium]